MPKIYKWFLAFIIVNVYFSNKLLLAKTIKANGESVFLSNIALGCNHALDQARQKAQILSGSAKILSFQTKTCSSNEQNASCILDKYSSLTFDSVIVEEIKLSEKISANQIKNQSIYTCEVQYEFDIKSIKQNNNIIYDFSLNNQLFLAPSNPESDLIKKNDTSFPELTFEIESNEPFYFYLFQQLNYLNDKKNIYLIYPNSIDSDVMINNKFTIPRNNDQYKLRISFPSNVDEPSIIIPLIGIISKEKLIVPSELSFDQLGRFLLKNQNKIIYFQKYYSVYKK